MLESVGPKETRGFMTMPHTSRKKSRNAADEVTFVLRRCALFYRASGFTEAWLENEWKQALLWTRTKRVRTKIYRAGSVAHYRAICERWIRDPNYLNRAGNPLPLPARGARSIQSLIKDLKLKQELSATIAGLEKIGSIEPTTDGRYLLVEKMFRTRPHTQVAYETFSQFLAHAVRAATMPLHVAKTDKLSHWLTASRDNLNPEEIREFIRYVKRRSQPQMLEIDDALNLRKKRRKKGKKGRPANTVGAAIFTFVAEPNSN